MKLSILLIAAIALVPAATWNCRSQLPTEPINQLSAGEAQEGWKLLFDGKDLNGWRSYRKPTAPDHGWEVKDGVLTCVAGAHGGDIITEQKFTDFDLRWEWRVPAGANNGIKYLVTEDRPSAPGHEYQMIDDAIVADKPKETTASFYDVLAPGPDKKLKPVGEWNHSRVLVKGNHVEHWLNGKRVLTYELGSPELLEAISKSKFKNSKGFADKITGPILLTEHHDEASFRNIKILELPAK
ncbi:MAG TPA: DUF1080 domain-containing protein [Verrucomicrobiae bacterium]|nr:DUF1080 domain-containing protein [Verrucomicrobiae bacterium]